MESGLKGFIHKIIRYRFIIAIVIFVLAVGLKLHGSSIGEWDQSVKEKINENEQTIILGKNRGIRSDEWLVQTPYYLAQAMNEEYYPLENKNITENGQNMIMSYNAPVANITVLGKPFNWGFLLLGKEYGLSWYWAFKIIGLILLSFEVSMIITKKNEILSFVGSFWIAFAPAVQWWFMQHVGDIVFFSLAMIVSFYKYFEFHDKLKWRILNSVIFAFSTIGFALVIYPALQVPFAYFIFIMMVIFFVNFIKNNSMDKADFVLIGLIIVTIGGILAYFLATSYESIKLSMNTVYPGKRVSLGGDLQLFRLGEFIINGYTPFKDINILNNCEVSSCINFFIGSVIIIFVSVKKKKVDSIGMGLFIVSVCELIWSYVQFPEWFAKITLLSYVPSSRMLVAFSFTAMLLSIWSVAVVFRENLFPRLVGIIIGVVNLGFYAIIIYKSSYRDYVSLKWLILIFAIYLVISVSLFAKFKKIFYISILGIVVISGMTVNPLARGVGAIYNKTLSKAILDVSKEDSDATWLAEGFEVRGNYLYANGVKTFNGTQFYPDMKKWALLDENGENEAAYNRYAHVRMILTEDDTVFNVMGPDDLIVNLNIEDLRKINIKYIVTKDELDNKFNDSKIKFENMYSSKVDGFKIYKVIY